MKVEQILYGSRMYQQTLKLRERVLRIPLGLKLSAQDIENEDKQRHFVVLDDEELMACVVYKFNSSTEAILRQFAVDERFQGQGVGHYLLDESEHQLADEGIASITMSARKTAVGFYERHGYTCKGDFYIQHGIEHITMSKYLDPKRLN
ncbi:GNAT family N-acetyltransferase [Bermanella sp. R86510]|uniref:GNAT family N-acetyltransferase n=1 Tax=unclassified Bermanella TaxID=2627862 RepID=UPI0037C80ECF